MSQVVHILKTNSLQDKKTLCGLIGGSAYNPVKSNCESCIEKFKAKYPGSYEQWQEREDK